MQHSSKAGAGMLGGMFARPLLTALLLTTPAAALPTATTPTLTAPVAAPSVATTIPTLPLRVVARYPHATDAFTEGLQLMGGTLYESTGLENESSVRRVTLKTGKIEQNRPPAQLEVFGEGLTVLGKVVYQLTWQNGLAFMYNAANLYTIGQLHYEGEGWGLTNDGKSLIMSNGSNILTWRNPQTFAITRSLKVMAGTQAVNNLNELEYVGGQVYANIWLTNRIARIDPVSGKVTAWIDVSALTREVQTNLAKQGQSLGFDDVANGIAYNPATDTFLLTGKRWPTVFEVKIGR